MIDFPKITLISNFRRLIFGFFFLYIYGRIFCFVYQINVSGPSLREIRAEAHGYPRFDTFALNYNLQTVTHLPQYNVQFSENQ